MIGNLEGTLTDVAGSSKCGPGSTDCVAFRAPARRTGGCSRRPATTCSAWPTTMRTTTARPAWPRPARSSGPTGMLTTGGPDEIAVTTVRGVRVAVVGFAPYGWAAPLNDPAAVRALVRQAAARADIVVVVFHGGAEGADALHVPAGSGDGVRRGPRRSAGVRPDRGGRRRGRRARRRPARGPRGRGRRRPPGGVLRWATSSATACCPPPACSAPPRSSSSPSGRTAAGSATCCRPTRQVQPGYPEPDPDRAAITLVRRLSTDGLRPDGDAGRRGRDAPPARVG